MKEYMERYCSPAIYEIAKQNGSDGNFIFSFSEETKKQLNDNDISTYFKISNTIKTLAKEGKLTNGFNSYI